MFTTSSLISSWYIEPRDESYYLQGIRSRCLAQNQEIRLQLYSNVSVSALKPADYQDGCHGARVLCLHVQ
jgi:hypothetical protein